MNEKDVELNLPAVVALTVRVVAGFDNVIGRVDFVTAPVAVVAVVFFATVDVTPA